MDAACQDALTTATRKVNYTREVDDRKWYNYEVNGPVLSPFAENSCHECQAAFIPMLSAIDLPVSSCSRPAVNGGDLCMLSVASCI